MTAPAKVMRRDPRDAVSNDQVVSQSKIVNKKCTSETPEQILILEALETFSQDNALSSFFHQAVTTIAEKLAATGAFLCLHCQEEDVLRLKAVSCGQEASPAQNSGHSSVSLSPSVRTCSLWQKLVRQPNPLLIMNAARKPRIPFRELLLSQASRHLVLLPLVSGDEVLGLIGILFPDASVWTPEKIELAKVLAQPAVLAARLVRLIDRARQSAVLQERSRIACDLHDTLAQGFTGVLIHMELAEERLFQDQQAVLRHIASARRMAREGMDEAHRAIFAIRPKALAKKRLAHALQRLAAEVTRDTRVRTTFSLCGAAPTLAPEVELELLRIAQEALTNILKHAGATTARIELVSDRHSVKLNIQDDGCGLKPWPSTKTSGLGLLGMTKRARQMGGHLEILPRRGAGTRIRVEVPLKMKPAIDRKCAS
jgi:signal transduction histidine kinase